MMRILEGRKGWTALSASWLPAVFLGASVLMLTGCAESRRSEPGDRLAIVDTVLSELGGAPTADMTRGQRWRMISSVGAGLPPRSFEPSQLPDPQSRGAVLVQVYCQRCHGLPAPQMHAADEWPILVRRMVMRARTLQDRMGGPATTGALGEILMAGMASADVPSAADIGILTAYLQANALPAADSEALAADPLAQAFMEQCSRCHETPSPTAHSSEEWPGVVARMRANTALMDVPAIPEEAGSEILAWLQAHAGS